MLKNLKNNWLIAVISGATGCVITLFLIFICHVKTWDFNAWGTFFNFFVAVGTIALAVFAWMAYKYATEQYLQNQKEKHVYDKKHDLICEIIDHIYSLYMDLSEMEITYKDLKSKININNEMSSKIISLENKFYINCDKRSFRFGSLIFNSGTLMKIYIDKQEQKIINNMLIAINKLNSEFLASNPNKKYTSLNEIMIDKNHMHERISENLENFRTYRESTVKISNKFIEIVQTAKILR